jgi:TRAP-type C4-dicarboxylate transport system permease large subunit
LFADKEGTKLMTIKRLPEVVLLSMAGIYLLSSLFNIELFDNILTVVAVAGLVFCCFHVRGTTGVTSFLLFLTSFIMLTAFNAPLYVWISALKKNISLITLYMLASFLGLPLNYGGYFPAFNYLSRKYIYSRNRLYIATSLLTFLFAIVANIGAQHIVFTLVSLMKKHTKVIAIAMTRGYICAMCWAPSMIPMIVVVNYTQASWNDLFPAAFFIAGCLWLIGWVIEIVVGKDSWKAWQKVNEINLEENSVYKRKIIEFSGIILLFVMAIFFIHGYLRIDIFTAVATISVLISFLWSVILRCIPEFISESKKYIGQILPRHRNQISLFWAVGFFGIALEYSGFGKTIVNLLKVISEGNSIIIVISMIALIFIPCLAGAHPMVLVVAIAGSVNPWEFGLSKELFSLVLLSGWVIGSVTSPLSVNNISAAGIIGVRTSDIGLRWNLVYAIISLVVTVIILTVFKQMGY